MFTVYHRTSHTKKRHFLGPIKHVVTKEKSDHTSSHTVGGSLGRAIAKLVHISRHYKTMIERYTKDMSECIISKPCLAELVSHRLSPLTNV